MAIQSPIDWVFFGEDTYSFKNFNFEDDSSLFHISPQLVQDSLARRQITSNLIENFMKAGLQQKVAAVILAHNRLSPRILMISQQKDLSADSINSNHYQGLGLPTFSCYRWELQQDILFEKLSSFIQYSGSHGSTEGFFQKKEDLTSSASQQSTSSRAAHLPFFRSATGAEDILTDTESEASRDSQISNSAVVTSNNVTNGLLPVNGDATPSVSATVIAKSTLQRGGTATTASRHFRPTVGHLLGVLWTLDFGIPPLPYVPIHVTRPKEQTLLFQVLLPPECDICLPKDFYGHFVPLETLIQHPHLGLAGIPSLLSRFTLKPMTCKFVGPTAKGAITSPSASSLLSIQQSDPLLFPLPNSSSSTQDPAMMLPVRSTVLNTFSVDEERQRTAFSLMEDSTDTSSIATNG